MSFKDVTTLGSVVKCFDSKRIPLSTREREMKQGRVPYYGAAGIIDYVNEPIFSGLYLLMGEDGSVSKDDGTPVLQLVSGEFWINNHAHVLQGETDIDTRYLYYALGKTNIQGFVTGAVQPKLNQANMNRIPVYYPEKSIRERIVDILGGLDDKIELNRQTNATLEAIAQAIFKEWFVDFNYPGATGEMVDSELGPIPKGWQVVNINSLSQVIYGAPFASSLFTKDSIGRPLIRIRDLPNEQPSAFTIEVHPKGYLAKPGDILVGMDGEFRAYLWGGDDSWVNQRICAFKPVIEIPSPFLYFSIIEPLAKVEATETATTVIHLGKNDIDLFRFALPSIEVLRDFGNITEPIFEKIIINKKESRILSTTRDILLTRLMTGKVEI